MCRGTRSHIIGEVGDDKPRDEPRDVSRHLDARRGRSSRRRAAQRAVRRAEEPGRAVWEPMHPVVRRS
jgi:hypothetical protein